MTTSTTTPKRGVVTPKSGNKTTPTTAPKKKASGKDKDIKLVPAGSGKTGDDPLAGLLSGLGQQGAYYDDGTDSPFESTYEKWLKATGAKLYTGGRPGTKSTHKNPLNMLSGLSKRDAATVKRVQEMLYAAGFYGNLKQKEIAWGDGSDPVTREAYAWAIALAVQTDKEAGGDVVSFDAFLLNKAKTAVTGDAAGAGPTFSYQPEDPAKIRRLLNEGLPEVMGRTLSPAETEALVAKWQQIAETDARNAFGVQQGGGVAAAQHDFTSFAQSEAERLHPDEVHARKLADLSEQFLASIQGATQADRVF